MCGITGIFAFNLVGKFNKIHVTAATSALSRRGPDHQDVYLGEWVALGHRRLSIIDTSNIAHQPMWDPQERYCIVFNGEIFNYRELKTELIKQGMRFTSESDTEVLLQLYIREKEKCLEKLNGFFAFCVYDKQEETLFLARDRSGIKPLLYVFDEDKFIFASEMKSILQYGIDKSIDYTTLVQYLQLNYTVAPDTIYTSVKKLLPGHYLRVSCKHMEDHVYYEIPYSQASAESQTITYEHAQEKLRALLEASVKRRLVSDVPLGAFLSGGIDSSVITALAAKYKPDLDTFSIGFRDEPFFDETNYAKLVAKKFGTRHTIFSLTNAELYENVFDILNYIDEPFADSSAINVFILSKETRKHATVALSGDGADELLSGYNKHAAFYSVQHPGTRERVADMLLPLLRLFPQSRNGTVSNMIRQAVRFGEGARLALDERYWKWAAFCGYDDAFKLLTPSAQAQSVTAEYLKRKDIILKALPGSKSINEVLLTDTKLVLPNDMLTKVDMMSMANGLEVRVPFLDFEVVNFIFSLPESFKITPSLRKRILQDAFRDILPAELYNRPKKGFEVPMLKWLRKEMKSIIEDDLLSEQRIKDQGIFEYREVSRLKKQLFSNNPGDVHARIWALIVFQWWWKKYHQ